MNEQQKHFNAFLESICSTSGHMDILKPLQEGFQAFCESTSIMELKAEQNADAAGRDAQRSC